jgi:hypothetical protein
LLEVIEKHFDGSKFHEYHAFWNLGKEWDTLVICFNTLWKKKVFYDSHYNSLYLYTVSVI